MCLHNSAQDLGTFTSGGAEIFMPDSMGCIPPVVSPTLGGSKFEYTSGGSCGCACNTCSEFGTFTCGARGCLPTVFRPRGAVFTCGAISTCGALGYLPPVGQRDLCLTAWGVYLRWFRLHSAGVHLCIPPVAPADVPAIFHPRIGTSTCGATDIYLRC